MYPPTPTPLPPPPIAPVVVNANAWRIWNFADDAVTMWNSYLGHSRAQVLQIAIIVVLVILFVFLLINWLQTITDEGA